MTTIFLTFYATGSTKDVTLHFGQFFLFVFVKLRSVSVNSKPDHPPGDPLGFARSSCPRGRVFALLSCPKVCPGVCPGDLKSK